MVLPALLGNQAQRYFVGSWTQQGFDGRKWVTPNRKIPDTREYKRASVAARTRATMIQSGALRRATGNSMRTATFKKTELIIDLPYAKRHNEGLKGMPQRQFVGQTRRLSAMQYDLIKKNLRSIWV